MGNVEHKPTLPPAHANPTLRRFSGVRPMLTRCEYGEA